jgi:hypothetical protein
LVFAPGIFRGSLEKAPPTLAPLSNTPGGPIPRSLSSGGGRGGKGLTRGEQPTGGRGSDTEPSCHVDPIGGCAPERMQFQNHVPPTFDLREEPGALAAHAGICVGGEE